MNRKLTWSRLLVSLRWTSFCEESFSDNPQTEWVVLDGHVRSSVYLAVLASECFVTQRSRTNIQPLCKEQRRN
jgi:hypothetical protein